VFEFYIGQRLLYGHSMLFVIAVLIQSLTCNIKQQWRCTVKVYLIFNHTLLTTYFIYHINHVQLWDSLFSRERLYRKSTIISH